MSRIHTLCLLIVALWMIVIFSLRWTLIDSINITFLVGIISLSIGTGIRIKKTGFLNPLIDGFQRLGELVQVKPRVMKRLDHQSKDDVELQLFKSKIGKWLDITVFSMAYASLALSVGGLFLYYI